MIQKTKNTTKKLGEELPLSKEIQTFVSKLLNSRGKLLTAKIGNASDPMRIKHEKLKQAFEYAKAAYKTDKAWALFIEKHEADLKYLLVCNKSRANLEVKLFNIYLQIRKM